MARGRADAEVSRDAANHDLPMPRATPRSRYVRVLVICTRCHAQAPQAIVDDGRTGTLSLAKLRLRCPQCGTDRTDFMMVARDW